MCNVHLWLGAKCLQITSFCGHFPSPAIKHTRHRFLSRFLELHRQPVYSMFKQCLDWWRCFFFAYQQANKKKKALTREKSWNFYDLSLRNEIKVFYGAELVFSDLELYFCDLKLFQRFEAVLAAFLDDSAGLRQILQSISANKFQVWWNFEYF